MNGNLILALAAGFVLGVIVSGLTVYVAKKILSKKSSSSVVAPYYDNKVFRLPDDLEKQASAEAKLHPESIRLPIIMYHYVEYVKDINDIIRKRLDIVPSTFEAEMKALHDNGYRTYFVRDIPDILNGNIVPGKQSVVLTFDDGYEDFYRDVFPLLKKYRMRATIYVIYDYINRKGFLTDAEIKEVLASGLVELGSHTLDHVYLKQMPESQALTQIVQSKQKLEKRFGVTVMTFAYPYGAFSADTLTMVKQAGYTAAVSVIPGVMLSESNLMYLPRIRPGLFGPQTMVKVLETYGSTQ